MDILGVYGFNNSGLLVDFLDELEQIRRQIWRLRRLPWCIGGDFNEVLYVRERHSGRRTRGMDCFGNFVDNGFIGYSDC